VIKQRDWELTLAHSFRNGITTAYFKSLAISHIGTASLELLRACIATPSQIPHHLLLPIIIFGHEIQRSDEKQRDVREWLRHIQFAVSLGRGQIPEHLEDIYFRYSDRGTLNLELIDGDIIEARNMIIWKLPQAYKEVFKVLCTAIDRFLSVASTRDRYEGYGGESSEIEKLHHSLHSGLELYRVQLTGIEHFF
jgi:hypothetical protein